MVEFVVEISDELKGDLEECKLDWSKLIRKFLAAKLFEVQLSKSIELQRAMFKSLADKSKLSRSDAKGLANKMNMGMLNELKFEFSGL